MRRLVFIRLISLRSMSFLISILLVCPIIGTEAYQSTSNDPFARTSVAFTPNHGQWDNSILFRTEASSVTIWFTSDGAYTQLVNPSHPSRITLIKMTLVDSDPNALARGEQILNQKSNYFLGNDPPLWRSNIPNYESIVYQNIYAGISLKYYGASRQLEYDFILSPGADPSVIQMEYSGADSLWLDSNGELIISTAFGQLREQKPILYQIIEGDRLSVNGEFVLKTENRFGFQITEDYNSQYDLIIDPVLSYLSYFGGSGDDVGYDIALDDNSDTYITGYTSTADFPTENPYQPTPGGGYYDVFISKFNSDGTGLIYSTYLGGSSDEQAYAIAIDSSGNAFVTGYTYSEDFPTFNAYQPSHGGGVRDIFITKLASSGDLLEYSTYLGGNDYDIGQDIEVDHNGFAFITGRTESTNFPTVNPYQPSLAGTNFDAFVTKLDNSGQSLEYSTYLGGSVSDYGMSIAVDSIGSAIVLGYTQSTDFPLKNSFQLVNAGGLDLFIAKLNGFGNAIKYGTYLGGSDDDLGQSIVIDKMGRAYITGYTFSTDFPTANAIQPSHGGGGRDSFIACLGIGGNTLEYSTYLGGSGEDFDYSVALDSNQNLFTTGITFSADFPTVNANSSTLGGKSHDAFVTRIASGGATVEYSTYLGGDRNHVGRGIVVDQNSDLYITGWAAAISSADLVSPNEVETVMEGGAEVFVAKLTSSVGCCGMYTGGFTGNIDCTSDGKRNLADITRLIDRVYVTKNELCCEANGNIDGDPGDKINLADITRLIDHVYVSKEECSTCN